MLYGQLVGSYDLRRVDGTSGHAVNLSAPVIHAASDAMLRRVHAGPRRWLGLGC